MDVIHEIKSITDEWACVDVWYNINQVYKNDFFVLAEKISVFVKSTLGGCIIYCKAYNLLRKRESAAGMRAVNAQNMWRGVRVSAGEIDPDSERVKSLMEN